MKTFVTTPLPLPNGLVLHCHPSCGPGQARATPTPPTVEGLLCRRRHPAVSRHPSPAVIMARFIEFRCHRQHGKVVTD